MTAPAPAPAPLSLLRLPEVLALVGLGRSAVYDLVKRGKFPQPVRLGAARCTAFSSIEVDEWIRARLAERAPAASAACRGIDGGARP